MGVPVGSNLYLAGTTSLLAVNLHVALNPTSTRRAELGESSAVVCRILVQI